MSLPDVTCAPIGDVWDNYPKTAALVVGIPAGASILVVGGIIIAYIAGAWGGIAAASLTPVTLIVFCSITIAALLALIAFLELLLQYLFKYKLACLDGDRCAVVRIQSIVHNEDSDQSLNTILAPLSDPMTSEADYKKMWQAGTLLYSDSSPPVSSRGWKFRPEANNQEPRFGYNKLPLFHCEIEGKTNYEWLQGLITYMIIMIVILAGIIALAAVGAALGPLYYVVAALIVLLALLALLFGIKSATSSDSESGDATSNTDIGSATPGPNGFVITDTFGRSIKVNDFALRYGLHVIDTGHHQDNDGCWCELHPVKAIAKIDQQMYDAVSDQGSSGAYDRLCSAMREYVQRPIGDVKVRTAAAPLEHERIG
jgi:hypothetical protein